MENKVSSVKCAQCGLVNFASAEVCKRCGHALTKVENKSECSSAEPPQQSHNPNLTPCPDCAHLCSRMAETCPNCGRFIQAIERPKKSVVGKIVSLGVIAVLCVCAALIFSTTRREAAVQSAMQKGSAADAGVSSGNREAARAAMNAVGELQSVTSVGTNFMQYNSALQSAKIKYDAAMRDFRPRDAGDSEIEHQLEEAINCYVDARDAWSEFIEHGSEYGFLKEDNTVLKGLTGRYGFSSSSGEYFKDEVIHRIWSKASSNMNTVSDRLR